MRLIPFAVSSIVTILLIFVLNRKWGPLPPLGKFLSPQHGFWQNAENADGDFNADLKFPGLKGRANVYFDDRLVPHVFADNDVDLYFVQGYLHAKFRLFQMDLQTMYAAGRLTEILGNDPTIIRVDRETRRSGMVYAAQNALKEFEADPVSKQACDSYTAGVNAYIESLTDASLPIEYKLLDFKPEKWNNLKIALFLKQMSRTLAGDVEDMKMTNEKSVIPYSDFKLLYPEIHDSLIPIVPAGTAFPAPGIVPVKPASADSIYFGVKNSSNVAEIIKQDPDNGSNNWAVAGIKTKSGAAILCNDPHLDLTFPSIWYEMQLNSPNVNVYGATFPGSPNVIIGFNDHIAWGVTNSQRDVKDFYEIKFKDDSKRQYRFNNQWVNTQIHIDTLKVRDSKDIYDTVAYTVFGPVEFDKSFTDSLAPGKAIACRWAADDPSNEGLTFYKLNRASNYDDYLEAIKTFSCPGQNFVFASKTGDIALWQQGKFPARWPGQGMMVMPGEDSSYLWQGYIPQAENPHVINPAQGYVVSANQRAADSSYPYFMPGAYINARAISINHQLQNMNGITVDDMKRLQNDYFNVTAEDARTLLLKYVRENDLNADGKKYLDIFKQWNLRASADSKGQTVYQLWWDSRAVQVLGDELDKAPKKVFAPVNEQTLLEALLKDSAFKYVDNVNTPQKETLYDDVTIAFQKASVELAGEEKDGKLEWAKHKSPRMYHLLQKSVMPFSESIPVGGNGDIINATNDKHGPSWRMVVQLSEKTEAYGVYPGGQSGNPGSKFYDDFVDSWVKGQYYSLWMMKRTETGDKKVKWTMNFSQ
ncbi:MAG TPA: penicillin acylase family protein [Chitinophagaceae bacterium]